jgi:outer membrane autotransporter protein
VAVAEGEEASASAVVLVAPTSTSVSNAGVLAAVGDGERIAIDARLTGGVRIDNYGLVAGSIFGSNGDDWIYNAQGGEIRLSGSTIDLGYFYTYGNYFENRGLVSIDGENTLVMGSEPQGLVPSANPNAFYNDGTLGFYDGDTDDYLGVVGDFAGEGEVDMDVDGLDHDTLYIDGSVVAGTQQAINVALHGLTNDIQQAVPLVYVSGDSADGQFTVGDVYWDEDDSFVTLDFDIVHTNGSGGDPDVFALGITASGLSDAGVVLANLPGAVQGLANAQVGTWRQRMGLIDRFDEHAVALWARLWNEKGGFSPEHAASNFGNGGQFNWTQKASGMEAGVDFGINEEFSVGLLLGQSKAGTHLNNLRKGSSDIDADTWGLYGTWISPTGFYLDASYRWMSFDVDMSSKIGARKLDGDAETFNVELGYAWTLSGGLSIEPQLQYTKTSVDAFDVVETDTGMAFASDGGDSSRGRAGVAVRKSIEASGWKWTPYASASVVREFDGKNRYAINEVLEGEVDMEGTSTLLELGLAASHGKWDFQGGVHWQDGGAVENFLGAQFNLRYTFGPAK